LDSKWLHCEKKKKFKDEIDFFKNNWLFQSIMICGGVHNKICYNKNPTCFSVLLIKASNMSSNLSTCWMIDLDKIDSLRISLLNYKILGYKECVRIVMMSVVCVSALFSWSGLRVLRFSQVDSSFFSFFKWFFFNFIIQDLIVWELDFIIFFDLLSMELSRSPHSGLID